MNEQISFINLLKNNLMNKESFRHHFSWKHLFFFFPINIYPGDCVVFLEMFFERSLWILQRERNGSLKIPLVLEFFEKQNHTLSLLFKKFLLGSGRFSIIQWMFSERKLAVASYSLWQRVWTFPRHFKVPISYLEESNHIPFRNKDI